MKVDGLSEPATKRHFERGRDGQRRGSAAETIEDSDDLRHSGHRRAVGHPRTEKTSHDEARHDDLAADDPLSHCVRDLDGQGTSSVLGGRLENHDSLMLNVEGTIRKSHLLNFDFVKGAGEIAQSLTENFGTIQDTKFSGASGLQKLVNHGFVGNVRSAAFIENWGEILDLEFTTNLGGVDNRPGAVLEFDSPDDFSFMPPNMTNAGYVETRDVVTLQGTLTSNEALIEELVEQINAMEGVKQVNNEIVVGLVYQEWNV